MSQDNDTRQRPTETSATSIAEPEKGNIPSPAGRLEAAVVDDSFEAGQVNAARLIIKNPFDVAVQILAIIPPRASSLRDLEAPSPEKDKSPSNAVETGKVSTSTNWLNAILQYLRGKPF
jgi:hypothetical protein